MSIYRNIVISHLETGVSRQTNMNDVRKIMWLAGDLKLTWQLQYEICGHGFVTVAPKCASFHSLYFDGTELC